MRAPAAEKVRAPAQTVDQERFFPFYVSTIANKISRGGSRIYLRLFGVGSIEWRILYVLARLPGVTAQTICNRIELDKAAASRSIQVLERLGYVATAADPLDGRKRILFLTEAGVALHDRILPVAMQRQEDLLVGFTPAEREVFLQLLKRMHANDIGMERNEYTAEPEPRPTGRGARKVAMA
jgi:DNA-binding MarR family transcriptional regulator